MRTDTIEFWNETWATMDHTFADYDDTLADHAGGLPPGRALDLGCGSGGNAVWLAMRGWQTTAVDFSEVAIEKARMRAADSGVEVEFVVSDVTTYRPEGRYDLIMSFYIQLWPEQRARMLFNAAEALAPGGRFLFVSHDKSSPPSGWSDEDLASLTTPEEVVAELPGLEIKRAAVVEEDGAHMAHMPDPDEEGEGEHILGSHEYTEDAEHSQGATTIVVAVRPG